MKIFLLVTIMAIVTADLRAQQDPLYAQYFNNPVLINPAFAGSAERLVAGLAYRKQWSGIEGGPVTFNFNSHSSFLNNKMGAGVIVAVDKLGESKTTQYGAVFSYRIALTTHTSLAFGMQAGVVQYEANMQGVQVQNPDPLFTPYSAKKFNTGAGVLLKNDRFAIGLSVPHLLPLPTIQGHSARPADQNFYVFAAYIFYVNDHFDFKPSTLLRVTSGTPVSADLNLNLIYNKAYTAGLFARNLNTYGILMQAVVQNVRVGYVFELPGKGSALNYNTHEISVAVSLAVLSSHNVVVTF